MGAALEREPRRYGRVNAVRLRRIDVDLPSPVSRDEELGGRRFGQWRGAVSIRGGWARVWGALVMPAVVAIRRFGERGD